MKSTGMQQPELYLEGAETLDESTLGGLMELYGETDEADYYLVSGEGKVLRQVR